MRALDVVDCPKSSGKAPDATYGRSVGSFCSNESLSESAGWRESRVWKALAPSWSKLKEREAQARS